MVHKFKLIFLLSLTLFPILGAKSFASVTMNEETAKYILDYFAENLDSRITTSSTVNEDYVNAGKNILKNTNALDFANAFNENINLFDENQNVNFNNLIVFGNANSSSRVYLEFFLNNGTYSNGLEYLKLQYNNIPWPKYNLISVSNADDNSGSNPTKISCSISNDKISFGEQTQVVTEIITNSEEIIDGEILYFRPLLALSPSQVIYYQDYANNEETTSKFLGYYYNAVPPVDIPDDTNSGDTGESGDTGGGTGGDTGGGTIIPDYSDDLDNIQTGITDINNNIGETNNKLDNISGELSNINNNLTTVPDISDTTITNEDITNNLDFEFMEDPYSNFWLELTTGLSGALTNNVRTLDINWLGHIHTIDLDKIGLKYPPSMELILKSTSTVAIVWVLVKWWKIIVDKLSSGNMDEVLAMNEEERNCRLILRGDKFVRSFI